MRKFSRDLFAVLFVIGALAIPAAPVLADGTCSGSKAEVDAIANPQLAVYDQNGDGIVCAWNAVGGPKKHVVHYSDNRI